MKGKFTLVKNVNDSSDLHGTSETTQEMNMVVRKNALFTKKTGVDLEIPAEKKHVPSTGNNSYTCYTCKQIFQSMNTLMCHRKNEHSDVCRPCEPKNGTCRFKDNPESCWFIHKDFSQVQNKTAPP